MRFRAGSTEVFLPSLLTSSLSSNRSRINRKEANIYWFIVAPVSVHLDALLEAMLSPDSQMSCDQLKKLDLSAMKAKCKQEFQILQETTKHQEDLETLAGNSSENNHKNRFPDLLPVDKFRPVLKSPGNLFGSNDYINATFAKDISQRGFIMTQSPLASTIEDIWRLVFDFDCTSIVMLNTVDVSDEVGV
ncbi:putative receptor-type tyrosine-protein phosphatase alpha [Apostichopus japonicus]|uniref:Putative receptor-type tyrosine-protein phosphatase alpha n=1 Tax=Stichopus japonicus TaxID=307972 RepID=A0A2G8K459_STIJA|nr:putative receptor-type tyrosine-protein phosphatase alpha [Apostichopus japonicus]